MITSNGLGCSACGGSSKYVEEGLAGILEGLSSLGDGLLRVCDASGNCAYVPSASFGAAATDVNNGISIAQIIAKYGGSTAPNPSQQVDAPVNVVVTPYGTSVVPVTTPVGTGSSPGANTVPVATPPATLIPTPVLTTNSPSEVQTPNQQTQTISTPATGVVSTGSTIGAGIDWNNILLFGGIGLLALAFIGGGSKE